MSTLILRDVTLAICGAPEARGDRGEHLAQRVLEVQSMDSAALEECVDLLVDADGLGEDADLELLIALMIVGVASPELCEPKGFSGLAVARRVALRLEQIGQADAALSVIEQLRSMYPGHQALERDYDAVLGRLGMVLNLADRYFDRAKQLLAAGEREEAVSWLREVLLLDSTRKDVARLIRDLRLKDARPKSKLRIRWGLLLVGTVLPLGLAGVVIRETDLRDQYAQLPAAQEGDLQSRRERLTALNQFAQENSVWHGSIGVQRERTQLRLDVDRLARLNDAHQLEQAELLESRLVMANSLRKQARRSVGIGSFQTALSLFEKARQAAPEGWEHAAKTNRDIDVIRKHIADLALETDPR